MQNEISNIEPRKIGHKMALSFCGRFLRKQAKRVSRFYADSVHIVVLACAWWYEFVTGFSVLVAHWPASFCHRFSRRIAYSVDSFVQGMVQALLLEWLAWLIAQDYLLAKR